MTEQPQFVEDDLDLDHEHVTDSRGRRLDAAYVERAVADVRARRGRPPLDGGGASAQVSLRVPEQVRRDLDELARSEGRSASEVVRSAIDDYLDAHRAV